MFSLFITDNNNIIRNKNLKNITRNKINKILKLFSYFSLCKFFKVIFFFFTKFIYNVVKIQVFMGYTEKKFV